MDRDDVVALLRRWDFLRDDELVAQAVEQTLRRGVSIYTGYNVVHTAYKELFGLWETQRKVNKAFEEGWVEITDSLRAITVSFAKIYVGEMEIDDILQQTAIRCWRAFDQYEPWQASFLTWSVNKLRSVLSHYQSAVIERYGFYHADVLSDVCSTEDDYLEFLNRPQDEWELDVNPDVELVVPTLESIALAALYAQDKRTRRVSRVAKRILFRPDLRATPAEIKVIRDAFKTTFELKKERCGEKESS